jgi:probable H4MPT-linked C1 transfer pathway protein
VRTTGDYLPSCDRANWLALDIGGANLKAADGCGWCHSEPFPLWQARRELPQAIATILARCSPDRLAVTMTGEIADCFADRADGVREIVTGCIEAAAGRPVFIYSLDGTLIEPAEAVTRPLAVAAANWHALARLAGSLIPTGRGLLLDIGSTTTDLVPLAAGHPASRGNTDWERMACGELLYMGVERTPVPALVRTLPYRSSRRPVASECFATVRDAWLTVGGLPERPQDQNTADGGPATRAAARIRLARTMLLEPADFSDTDARQAAAWITELQCRRLTVALKRQLEGSEQATAIVTCGHGGSLAKQAIARLDGPMTVCSLAQSLGDDIARVGPAHAVARIARGEL